MSSEQMAPHPRWITPDWPAPANVMALITTRAGGVSHGPYGVPPTYTDGMNVGFGSDDDAACVAANRARLRAVVPTEPRWLRQVHGSQVVDAAQVTAPIAADASFTSALAVVAAVMVADCLPVLFTDLQGRCVGVAHAGWRGLAAGVLQNTVSAMRQRIGDDRADLLAYLGPGIGPRHFEVGPEVLDAMKSTLPNADSAFVARGHGKYLADLAALARQALQQVGIGQIQGGVDCTFSDPTRFYSHRRDRVTGRHVALIWRRPASSEHV